MTVIAAVKDGNGEIFMGCDGIATDAVGRRNLMMDGKIVLRNNMLMGVSGSAKWLNILRYHPELPQRNSQDAMTWLNMVFCPWLYDVAKTNGILLHDEEQGDYIDLNLLIGFEGELYLLTTALSAECITRDFHAIGSGCDEARAVLYVLRHKSPNERIDKALDACAELLCGIQRPFYHGFLRK